MIKGWGHLRFWKTNYEDTMRQVRETRRLILPHRKDLFRALELTPYDRVRCVILGQDPYPTRGHANGLAFSVYPHVSPLPRSLRNIFTEYQADLGYGKPRTGDLRSWAEQGVLLLNSILTVEEGKSLSHAGLGWEKLSFEILRSLAGREGVSGQRGDVVYILWGKAAQEYAGGLPRAQVVSSPHPSPYSAKTGFFGSRPFSRVNEILKDNNQEPINWRLP